MAAAPIYTVQAMRSPRLLTIALIAAAFATVASVAAQSLADVARREEARRKEIRTPSKVLTNDDLAPASAGGIPPPPADAPGSATSVEASDAAKSGDARDKSAKDANDKDARDKEPVKDQKYWAGRLKALQDALSRDQTYSDALQSRINALTRDFVNEADPVKQRTIGSDRQKAIDELDRLKKQIADDKKALADFDEEARRAGVPPGWLR